MQNIINTNEDEKIFLKLCETLLITVYSTISTADAAAVSATTNIARVRALSRVVVLTIWFSFSFTYLIVYFYLNIVIIII